MSATLIPTPVLAKQHREQRRHPSKFRWGMPWLEANLPAPWAGSLTTIGAATNTGKTFLQLAILRAMAEYGPTAFISLEDAPSEIGRRADSGIAHPNLFASFPEEPTLSSTVAAMEAAAAAGCIAVGVDYLQKILYDSPIQAWGKVDAIGNTVTKLQTTAKRLGLPLLLNSQLRRPGNDDRGSPPEVTQLKGAGEIENDSDFVLLMWGKRGRDTVVLEVGKAKAAPVGARCRFRRGAGGVLVPVDERADEREGNWG